MAWSSVRHLSAQVNTSPASGTLLVSDAALRAAENQVEGCARCDTSSDVSFGAMLRCFVSERSPESLAFDRTAKCPNCGAVLTEQSLVCWD